MTGVAVYLCNRCKRLLPVTPDYYYVRGNGQPMRPCRECRLAAARARYAELKLDPEWLRATRERNARTKREARAAGHESAERDRESARRWKAKAEQDPEYRARRAAMNRISGRLYWEKRTGVLERSRNTKALHEPYSPPPFKNHAGPMLEADPLVDWLRREFSDWPDSDLARKLGVDDTTVRRLRAGEAKHVSLYIADRIFVTADCPHLLAVLYPLREAAA